MGECKLEKKIKYYKNKKEQGFFKYINTPILTLGKLNLLLILN